ncbi:TonB-dependent receptor plug domain-containing protein [bacterium]|nr:TonB-dependent receptor plug domain-containing protein [bacterium]
MGKKIFIFLLILSLSTGIASRAFAQGQTGSIKGKITDKAGNPLPDAFIYVSSPAMLGIRTYLSSKTGAIRFPGLPPGIYKIMAEKPEFKTVNIEDIIVRVGQTVSFDITLEATLIEEEITSNIPSPTLDEESTKTSVNIDRDLLNNIPFARNLHEIINSAAGVTQYSVPNQKASSVHGSTVRANIYTLDGIIMNDPSGMHLLTNINFDIIEEVELETAAHPAQVRFTEGGYINVVAKSGGNRFRGDINFYGADEQLVSTLRSEEEINETGASPPPLDRYLGDISFSLGGALLEDKIWFFTNARFIFLSQTTDFISWTDPQGNSHKKFSWRGNEKMGFLKLTSQFIPQLKVTGMFYYFNRYQSASESPLSWNLPKEATQILDHEKNLTASGTLSYIFDQNTFGDIKAGYIEHNLPLRLDGKWRDNPQYSNEGTGHFWGSAGFNETQLKKRFQVGAYLTRFQEGFLGDHEFKSGVEYEFASGEWTTWKTDNLLQHYFYGNPYYFDPNYFGQAVSPVTGNPVDKGKVSFSIAGKAEGGSSQNELSRLSLFAQDSVSFGRRLTLFLGLRFDRSSTKLLLLEKGESGNPVSLKIGEELIEPLYGVNPYSTNLVPEWQNIMVWNALSPRFGLSFDILGNGKHLFKASFSRYTEYLMLDYLRALNPFYAHRSHQFYWFDENMDGIVDVDDTYTLYPEDLRSYSEEDYKKRIAPDIKPPYTDEFTIGLHQELFKDFSIRINYIHKTKLNIIENVLYDPDSDKDWYTIAQDTQGWWIPFETIVPEVDDFPDTQVSAYYRSSNTPVLFYQVKNVPELKRKYQALEIAFQKRMLNNLQLNGSLVISKTTGNIGLNYDASSGFSRAADNPNFLLVNLPEDSSLDFDRPLVLKLMGTYKFPYDFFASCYYTYMSGTPLPRSVTIIPPASWIQDNNAYSEPATVLLEKPGTRRAEPYHNLDLRIEKEFRFGSSGRVSMYVDILNVLGKKYSFISKNDGGFWFPDAENTTQGTRVLSENYKKITSLSGTRTIRLGLNLRF